jgi:hypothetical protein
LTGPFKVGDKVDGVQGTLVVYRHIFKDGKEALEADLSGEPGDFYPDYWTLRLEGDQAAALEPYAGLPMRVWGTVSGVTPEGLQSQLERFEAYPIENRGLAGEAGLLRWKGKCCFLLR